MSDLRKAAEMSIEAIMDGDVKDKAAAVYALRQALAQPEWVGLTDEEIWDLGADNKIDVTWAHEIEAKLKEKNT